MKYKEKMIILLLITLSCVNCFSILNFKLPDYKASHKNYLKAIELNSNEAPFLNLNKLQKKDKILEPETNSNFNSFTYIDNFKNQENFNQWNIITPAHEFNEYQKTPYVSNGYIGARIPFLGSGFMDGRNFSSGANYSNNGWPLFNPRYTGAFLAGFWNAQNSTPGTNFPQTGYESVISSIPIWNSLFVVTSDNISLHTSEALSKNTTEYKQSFSLQTGLVSTQFKWWPYGINDKENRFFILNYTVYAHQARPTLGLVRLDITSSNISQGVKIIDVLDGQGSYRSKFYEKGYINDTSDIFTSVYPDKVNSTVAFEYSTTTLENSTSDLINFLGIKPVSHSDYYFISNNDSTIASQLVLPDLLDSAKISVIKYVGIVSNDIESVNTITNAKNASINVSKNAASIGWNALLLEHETAWNNLWDSADIIIPSNDELQLSVRASLYHLLSSMRSGYEEPGLGDNSIPVSGLSSDSYAGFIFWDADLWMYLGVLPLFPDHAKSIINYRSKTHNQARKNAISHGLDGAAYPWTSGRLGKCTGTGPCVDYQYHLNTDIALSAWQYYLSTGDIEFLRKEAWPIISDAARLFASYVIKNNTLDGKYTTTNLTDPDEYSNFIDNGAFTNAGISQLMKWSISAGDILGINDTEYNSTIRDFWKDISENIYIPYNKTIDVIEEFSGMNDSLVIKQADVTLLDYPLNFTLSKDHNPLNDLNYYSKIQSPDGPAMSWAIYSINAVNLVDCGDIAYTYLTRAHEPFTRGPFYQFSEQMDDNPKTNGGTNPAFPFLTGHGGYLQTWIQGLGGIRFTEDYLLVNSTFFSQISPDPFILKGIKWKGASFDVVVGPEKTTVIRNDKKYHQHSCTFINSMIALPIAYPDLNDKYRIKIDTLLPGQAIEFNTNRPDLCSP